MNEINGAGKGLLLIIIKAFLILLGWVAKIK